MYSMTITDDDKWLADELRLIALNYEYIYNRLEAVNQAMRRKMERGRYAHALAGTAYRGVVRDALREHNQAVDAGERVRYLRRAVMDYACGLLVHDFELDNIK